MWSVAALSTARAALRSAPVYSATLSLAARRHFSMSPRVLGIVKVPEMAESLTSTLR